MEKYILQMVTPLSGGPQKLANGTIVNPGSIIETDCIGAKTILERLSPKQPNRYTVNWAWDTPHSQISESLLIKSFQLIEEIKSEEGYVIRRPLELFETKIVFAKRFATLKLL